MTTTHTVKLLEDEGISRVAQRVIDRFDPDCVYLFGSRARGDFGEDSDYDFMVIVPDNFSDDRRSSKAYAEALSGLGIYHDVKISKRCEFERQLHLKASMPSSVLRDGRLLYLRDGATAYESRDQPSGDLYVREESASEYDPVQLEITQEWLRKAKNDVRGAEIYTRDIGEPEEALFHCQQAIEKSMKAFIVWHDQPYIKTHGLGELAELCLSLDRSLAPLFENVESLSRWSVDGRYVHDGDPGTIEDAQAALQLAKSIIAAIRERLPEPLRDLPSGGDRI